MTNNRIMEYLGGIVVVRVNGPYPEKIINLALSRGMFLSDVHRDNEGLRFSTRSDVLDALQNIVEEFGYELTVIERSGLPFFLNSLKNRWMMAVGAILFVSSLYFLSSFIWYIEIRGSNVVQAREIARIAEKHGLRQWAFKGSLSKTAVEEGMLQDIPRLSYAEVDIKGVIAVVRVVEKVLPGNEISGPCHITAARGGIIEEILVLKGTPLVKVGDTVGFGEILISGAIVPAAKEEIEESERKEEQPILFVRALGEVKARVWYEGYGEQRLTNERRVLTGRKAERISIWIARHQLTLRRPADRFQMYEKKSFVRRLNSPWGQIMFQREIWKEVRKERIRYTRDQAVELATREAVEELQGQIKSAEETLNTRVRCISSAGDKLVRIKADAEVLQEIGRSVPINMESYPERKSGV